MSAESPIRPLVVLSMEGLARSSIGCYGCSWNQTPAIDAIAGGGVVWDRLIAEHDTSSRVLQSWLDSDWMNTRRQAGSTLFVTDTSFDASRSPFSHCVRYSRPANPDRPAEDIVETQLGQLVVAAIECDQSTPDWSVLWIHSDSLARCWDAPRSLYPIEQLDGDLMVEPEEFELLDESAEDAPAAPAELEQIFETTSPPDCRVTPDDHPDWLSSWMRTYACQVRLLDVLIEVLLESLTVQDPLLVLAGTSGFRLGQGGWIGSRGETLRSTDIHLPFVVSDLGPLRIPRLIGSGDVTAILEQLSDGDPHIEPQHFESTAKEGVCVETRSIGDARAITTPTWFYVHSEPVGESLFLKPDDVEDFNDVARVEVETTAAFRSQLDDSASTE